MLGDFVCELDLLKDHPFLDAFLGTFSALATPISSSFDVVGADLRADLRADLEADLGADLEGFFFDLDLLKSPPCLDASSGTFGALEVAFLIFGAAVWRKECKKVAEVLEQKEYSPRLYIPLSAFSSSSSG